RGHEMNLCAMLMASVLFYVGFVQLGVEIQTKLVPINQSKAIKSANSYNQIVTNGAARLDVTVRGEGDTVIMLPSLGRSVRDFDQISERLVASHYRVVLPEP